MNPPHKPHFTLIRSFTLADLFTFGNAASGMGAIFCCLDWMNTQRPLVLWLAFLLLPLALVFDFLDGRIARWRHSQSTLGADLDSLADTVSFGVGPAVLGFTLGLRGILDILCLIFFVSCGISRLARFNVTSQELSDESGKVRYFEGTPIPTSLALVLLWAIALITGHTGETILGGSLDLVFTNFHPIVLLYVLSGCAMVSGTLRIPKI